MSKLTCENVRMAGNEHESRAGSEVSRPGTQETEARETGARETIVHGSAVAWGERGVLILGASGAGKSGLALRLIAAGATLVADDRVVLRAGEAGIIAAAPAALAGLIEARGVGILRMKAGGPAPLVLAVDLDHAPEARLPERRKTVLLGRQVRLIRGARVPNIDVIIMVMAKMGADPI